MIFSTTTILLYGLAGFGVFVLVVILNQKFRFTDNDFMTKMKVSFSAPFRNDMEATRSQYKKRFWSKWLNRSKQAEYDRDDFERLKKNNLSKKNNKKRTVYNLDSIYYDEAPPPEGFKYRIQMRASKMIDDFIPKKSKYFKKTAPGYEKYHKGIQRRHKLVDKYNNPNTPQSERERIEKEIRKLDKTLDHLNNANWEHARKKAGHRSKVLNLESPRTQNLEKSILKKVNRELDYDYDLDDFYGYIGDLNSNYHNSDHESGYNGTKRGWIKGYTREVLPSLTPKERRYIHSKFLGLSRGRREPFDI